ncbi:MAG: flagellar hook protein FlgE [Clostridiales bacterium]|nr:flagellar hook protein FlgE [Clostridiales bacterium]
MMRSMFSGVSGLRSHQTKMDVIAHNISNVNTVGFKSSRVTFNDVFSQTLSGASRANEATGKGGTNPMQIGLGVNVASIDKNMGTGASQRTDRAMDMMINGEGFFIVGDASGTYFTRAGAFDVDEEGWLVAGNGMRVMGWDTTTDPDTGEIGIQQDRAEPIFLGGDKEIMPPATTQNIDLGGNLNALAVQASPDGEHVASMSFYDSLGNRYVADVTFTYTPAVTGTGAAPAYWTYTIDNTAYPNGDRKAEGVDISGGDGDTEAILTGRLEFNELGKLSVIQPDGEDNQLTITAPATTISPEQYVVEFYPNPENLNPAAEFANENGGALRIDFSGLTQYATATNAKFTTVDGNSGGTLEELSVGSDGIITGRYSNGDMRPLGQIPVATFQNPAGLQAVGNNLYVTTANSGEFDGRGEETGDMMGGSLEMSNVDLSMEFTEMITTQRGFQANSRVITTSDEMLQELVNLKR